MLHVILGILKVIGIILLAAVGLILFSLLALLFVPIRYRIAGKKEEAVLEGRVQISWLLRIIGFDVECAKGQLVMRLKLFGLTLKRIGGEEEKKRHRGGSGDSRKRGRKEDSSSHETEMEDQKELLREISEEQEAPSQKVPGDQEDWTKASNEMPKREEPKRREQIFGVLMSFPEYLLEGAERLRNILDAGEEKAERWKTSCEKLRKRAAPFLEEESKALYGRLLGHLKYLWKHYGPRSLQGWLRFGTGAPDVTGELTGVLYLLLPASAGEFEVFPDFTETIFETEIRMKGHIRSCHLVKIAVSLWLDKRLRKLIRKARAKGGE